MDQSLGSKENIGQKDIFDLFPRVSTFRKDKLPTLKETIGVARGYKNQIIVHFKMQPLWWPISYMITGLAEIYTLLLDKGLRRNLIKNSKK